MCKLKNKYLCYFEVKKIWSKNNCILFFLFIFFEKIYLRYLNVDVIKLNGFVFYR